MSRGERQCIQYVAYVRQNQPIASGVMEASCKTLVTQCLKQSRMAWTRSGGQAILTLRSLIQSDRWEAAWELLRTDFRETVTVGQRPHSAIDHLGSFDFPLAV